MVQLITFGVMAIAATAVSAIDIKFSRFAKHGCDSISHISADTHLHDPHCKTFDESEPRYYSFNWSTEDDGEDLDNKQCQATVYSEADCHGEAQVFTLRGTYSQYSSPSQIADS